MNGLIKETNDNLKAIVDTLKINLETSINTLDNIQVQMDKKVEEAKKYKIQVDSAKEVIRDLEDENKSFELSLKELNDKYGKMNLVSVIEAGNREIKSKINDNIREINKQKEHIADLTNKARTIKDLLINLKKDKNLKEEKLENIREVYEYYSERVNDIIDYAFNHSENLSDYKNNSFVRESYNDFEVSNKEIENTMLFDEIASIDDNKLFKDEMSFIHDQIDSNINKDLTQNINDYSFDNVEDEEESIDISDLETTKIFDAIIEPNYDEIDEVEEDDSDEVAGFFVENESNEEDTIDDDKENDSLTFTEFENSNLDEVETEEVSYEEPFDFGEEVVADFNLENDNLIEEDKELNIDNNIVEEDILKDDVVEGIDSLNKINTNLSLDGTEDAIINEFEPLSDINEVETELNHNDNDVFVSEDVVEDNASNGFDSSIEETKIDLVDVSNDNSNVEPLNNLDLNFNIEGFNNVNIPSLEELSVNSEVSYEDREAEERSNKIENLFSTLDNIKIDKTEAINTLGIENKIDNAYSDTFGKSINEELKVESTLTDIFGNPIKSDEINKEIKEAKSIENVFVENGIDFNKFREDEQNYLKEIYDEEKFVNIFNTLKRNMINVDNVYNAFNIFGEITANELENIISKLLNIGQSAEAIGIILEKLPRVKKYNLDDAITSYGDYIKDIDITELVMKAKELYKNGGNI